MSAHAQRRESGRWTGRRWSKPQAVTVAVVLALLAAIGLRTEYRSAGAAAEADVAGAFDPARYGAETYQGKVVPAIRDDAVDLAVLLAAVAADKDAAGAKYGHRQGTGPYSFAVTGVGVAGEVKGNLLAVAVPGLPSDTKVWLQVGPAVTGTALRDAAGFITFGQFLNQVQYAEAATALNNEMRRTVLSNLDVPGLKGKRISFTGAFNLLTPATITITPIAVEAAT